jgi:hypothetical protein
MVAGGLTARNATVAAVFYGFVFTAVGLAEQAGVIHLAKTADRRALAWHAYLWDPWFLVWGLLAIVALRLTRPTELQSEEPVTGPGS